MGMKRARKVRLHESEDISEGDHHAQKYSKGKGQYRDKISEGKMASYHRSSADGPAPHQCSKSRHSHKHTSDNLAHDAQFASRTRQHRTVSPDSDSSDEILIKGPASRRARRHTDKDVSRQLKDIEKANLDVLRSSSASSGEIHIHFVPVVTKSASPPLTESRQSSSRSSSDSKSTPVSVSNVTSQLKGLTKSWLGRRSKDSLKTSRPTRSKHEKRDKHGKKRVPVSQYLAPLAQRWVCYGCGKVRSGTIQARHPLQEGHRMHPNWCGKCRVHGELQGRPCSFEGKRHYCWGCGIVRSQTYNDDNPLHKESMSEPNYCRPCRESSPTFNRSLREASEDGSAVSILDKAFTRAMHDAELSDVEGVSGDQLNSAPGKENQDPRPRKKKLKASDSFMLENFSYKVKTTSDASSADDGVPISILKALYLDKERSRSTRGATDASSGGCRLSGSSYQPPVVESDLSEECKPGLKVIEPMVPLNEVSHYNTMSPTKSRRGEEPSSPMTVLPYKQHDSDNSDIKKKRVHWYKHAPKSTAIDSNPSDSAYCSNRLSGITVVSNGSNARRVRRGPGEYSTGSPPVHEGETTAGDLRHDVRKQENASVRRPVTRGKDLGLSLPTEGTFGRPASSAESDMASHRHDSTESSNTHSTPPTPPEAHVHAVPDFGEYAAGAAYDKPIRGWNASPDVPNFSRPYLSPKKQRSKASHKPEPIYRPGYDARAGNMQEYSSYQSAAHFIDSTQDHDLSRFGAPGEEYAMHNEQYVRRISPVQHGEWPPHGRPTYNDYNTGPEHNDREWAGSYGEGHTSPAESTGHAAFDFSSFGAASSEVHESVPPVEETFVRKKKTSQSTPKPHTWHLYDDGENFAGNEPAPEGFSWKIDGRTTVHRSGGSKMPNEGKMVHILSIREMRSDEELTVSDDYDEASVIGNVMADRKTMKFICEA